MLVGFIIGGEIGFWVLLGAGLAARYVLRMRRASNALLIATPFVDLVLLAATAVDLRSGAEPSWQHGLAAAYLGFSVAFGPSLVRWADARFAYWFAGGERPLKPPESPSWERAQYEWQLWVRMLAAAGLSCCLLLVAIWYVGDADRTAEFWDWMARMGGVTVIWLVGWPVWETVKAVTAHPARG